MNDYERNELKRAVDSLRAGDKRTGAEIIVDVLKQNENNDVAWMWLSATTDDPQKRKQYLSRAISINPKNEKARAALRKVRKQKPKVRRKSSILSYVGIFLVIMLFWYGFNAVTGVLTAQTIHYEVIRAGNDTRSVEVTYVHGAAGVETRVVRPPWESQDYTLHNGDFVTLSAVTTAFDDLDAVRCRVIVNGKTWLSSDGQASCTCSGVLGE